MKNWLMGIAVVFLSACASTPMEKVLADVKVGMDKDHVLHVAGNPKRTFREHSQDHWIYVYFHNDQEMNRIVSFEDGKVTKLSAARAKTNWEKELEGSQKSSDAGFKSIDGESERP